VPAHIRSGNTSDKQKTPALGRGFVYIASYPIRLPLESALLSQSECDFELGFSQVAVNSDF
jgi:hypothetical protein